MAVVRVANGTWQTLAFAQRLRRVATEQREHKGLACAVQSNAGEEIPIVRTAERDPRASAATMQAQAEAIAAGRSDRGAIRLAPPDPGIRSVPNGQQRHHDPSISSRRDPCGTFYPQPAPYPFATRKTVHVPSRFRTRFACLISRPISALA